MFVFNIISMCLIHVFAVAGFHTFTLPYSSILLFEYTINYLCSPLITVNSSLNGYGPFAKNQAAVYVTWFLFCSVSHSISVCPVPIYVNFSSFEMCLCTFSNLFSLEIVLAIFITLHFHIYFGINLSISCKHTHTTAKIFIGTILSL